MSGATSPVTAMPSEHGQNMFSKVNVTYVLPSFDSLQKNCYVLCVCVWFVPVCMLHNLTF
jgi:hypothetical protein